MKILLFGGSGQLGQEIITRSQELNFLVVAPPSRELDIGDLEQVQHWIHQSEPDLVINSAAYTNVDKAESEQELAYRINRDGPANIAASLNGSSIRLIHVSTDYVFSGTAEQPLLETDECRPSSVYGKSKLAGEQAIFDRIGDQAVVLRASSLHGRYGNNFVHTMLSCFKEKDRLNVVNDQWMSPTWAGWLAEVILDLARVRAGGLFHSSCRGAITWFDFASRIEASTRKSRAGKIVTISPVPLATFPRPARRPQYSVMNCSKLESVIGRACLPWEAGLSSHLKELSLV